MSNSILVVDDEEVLAQAMGQYLERHGFSVDVKSSGEEALRIIDAAPPEIVLLDYRLPRMDGLEVLRKIKDNYSGIEVIILTAHGSVEGAVEAMKLGAFDYLSKPLDLEELRLVVQRAFQSLRQTQEIDYLRSRVDKENPTRQIVGLSASMVQIKNLVEQISAIEAASGKEAPAILITGETGTGKELIARAIHARSLRAKRPFVEINCAAIPDNLLEAELFGHEKGAFTDAKTSKLGLFEAADSGTIFLDEIGSMDLNLQAKLLKAIEEKSIRRVGSIQSRKIDVMVIAATNQPLEEAIREKSFREDLYYRLKILEIHLPPLRNREGDAVVLAEHFTHLHARRYNRGDRQLSEAAKRVILQYNWPGNVRELSNVIERAVLLKNDRIIEPSDLALTPIAPSVSVNGTAASDSTLTIDLSNGIMFDDVERQILETALTCTGWNRTRAAQLLGMSRETLRYRIEKHNLKPPHNRIDY